MCYWVVVLGIIIKEVGVFDLNFVVVLGYVLYFDFYIGIGCVDWIVWCCVIVDGDKVCFGCVKVNWMCCIGKGVG